MTLSLNKIQQAQVKHYVMPADEKFKVKDVHHVKIESAQERQIKAQIDEMRAWENHVKKHELAHALVGGADIGTVSYVYTYGPDGRKYIQGGQVSVHIPGGLDPVSISKLQRLKKATGASHDMSTKDMTSAAVISAIERSRRNKLIMKNAIKKYEKSNQEKALMNIKEGNEIFIYKKMNVSSVGLIELFV